MPNLLNLEQNATLDALRTTIRLEFNAALKNTRDDAAAVSRRINDPSYSCTHAWLDDYPDIEEWISGNMPMGRVKENAYVTYAKRYGKGIEISLSDIQLDNIGHYPMIGASRGESIIRHKNRLVFNQLKLGDQRACFDGQNFFDDEHPVFPNTDGTGTAFTDPERCSNVMGGTSSDAWYLLVTDRQMRPIIHHVAIPAELLDGPFDDNSAIRTDSAVMGVKSVEGAAYGFWQTAVMSQQTLTASAFSNAYDRIAGFVANGGAPLANTATLLVVPTGLRGAAEDIIQRAETSGSTNTDYKRVDLLVTPWLN